MLKIIKNETANPMYVKMWSLRSIDAEIIVIATPSAIVVVEFKAIPITPAVIPIKPNTLQIKTYLISKNENDKLSANAILLMNVQIKHSAFFTINLKN